MYSWVIAFFGQDAEHPGAVGADQRAWLNGGACEVDELFGPWRIGNTKTNAAESEFPIHLCTNIFHRNHDRCFVGGGA